MLGFCGIFVCTITQFYMSKIGLSTNASPSHNFLFVVEYFIDEEKYFYLILLHINMAICIGVITIVAIGAMMIAYTYHTCGMFRIAK